jgi:hypothetical protein
MDDYYSKDNKNRILLEGILRREFLDTGMSFQDVAYVAKGVYNSVPHIRAIVNACKQTIIQYEDIKGALSKGELNNTGGRMLGIMPRKFDRSFIQRQTYKTEGTVLNIELAEEGFQHNQIKKVLDKIDASRVMTYQGITKMDGLIWFKDNTKAQIYIKEFLTRANPFAIQQKILSNRTTKPTKNKGYRSIEHNKHEQNVVNTKDDFEDTYNLSEDPFAKTSQVNESEIEQVLNQSGPLDMSNITTLRRTIIRNATFAEFFKIPGSEYFSGNKLRKLTEFYYSASSDEREQFWTDAEKIFGVKRI